MQRRGDWIPHHLRRFGIPREERIAKARPGRRLPWLRRPPRPARRDGVGHCGDRRIERPVFICGLQRDGTTLPGRIRTVHCAPSCLRAGVPECEGGHMQPVHAPASSFGGPGRFAVGPAMSAELPALSGHAGCRDRL